MARVKINNEVIKEINESYLELKTYAAVARKVGVSPSTVKKYVIPNYKPLEELPQRTFIREDYPEFSPKMFEGIENWGELCVLSDDEKKEIEELWEEMVL